MDRGLIFPKTGTC